MEDVCPLVITRRHGPMGHVSGTVRATGKSYEGPFALHLAVEDSRITRHHLYENSLSIAEACAT
jgi:ketosteroid isomerase-like protein